MRADFLIGGGGGQIALHNTIARRRFERGDVPILLGTSVTDRGMDLKGANVLVEYDLSYSDRQKTQREGRVGRQDDLPAKCISLVYTGAGSQDQMLLLLNAEDAAED